MKKIGVSIFVFFLGMVVAGLSLAEEEKIGPEIVTELEMMQADIAARGLSFTVGYSKAMEYSKEQLCGYIPPSRKARISAMAGPRPLSPDLPKRWNWKDLNGVSAIGDQNGSGACWAFGTTGPFECNLAIHKESSSDLSEQYIISCTKESYGCNTGGTESHQYHCCTVPPGEYAQDGEVGGVLEADFPFQCTSKPDTPPCEGPYDRPYCIDGWDYVYVEGGERLPSVDDIKQAIFDYGPVSASVVWNKSFSGYRKGIFDACAAPEAPTDHAIVLVGWDDTQGENGVWILRNSWGTWGEAGYMRIQYGCSAAGENAAYVVYKGGALSSSGLVALERYGYPCSATVNIILRDKDLAGGGSQDATLTSNNGDQETVGLAEGENPGNFFGHIITEQGFASPEDGTLQVQPGGTITVTYIDEDDGRGGENIEETYTSYVDCESPEFEGLIEATAGSGYVLLEWAMATDDYSYDINDQAPDPNVEPIRYNIYRRIEGEEWELIRSTYANIYVDYEVEPGKRYYYTVRAEDAVENEDENTTEKYTVPLPRFIVGRVSVDNGGDEGNGRSRNSSISSHGRYVAFESVASNLVDGDANGVSDIFVYDRFMNTVERISIDNDGTEGNSGSYSPGISGDGRYVAFESFADSLVEGDNNSKCDIFVYDRNTDGIERVSVANNGKGGNGGSFAPGISADGRYVAFYSFADNLVTDDTNGKIDVFVYDRISNTIELVSMNNEKEHGNGNSYNPSISADGRYVAFHSLADNLVERDFNRAADVFVFDRQDQTMELISKNGNNPSLNANISADGRHVAFQSFAYTLLPARKDKNSKSDIFVFDRETGTIELISWRWGWDADSAWTAVSKSESPSISADGRYVAFSSFASNIFPEDKNGQTDIFVFDREKGAMQLATITHDYKKANKGCYKPSISGDGMFVSFDSKATNVVEEDLNEVGDVFVIDMSGNIPLELSDSDGDGVADDQDNCRMTPNPNQEDTDADGYGNACDCDIAPAPGDGRVNFLDKVTFMRAFGSHEGDPNFNPDADFTGPGSICDGRVNLLDRITFMQRWNQPPGD